MATVDDSNSDLAIMIDETYEFSAPRFFDFVHGESEEDKREAELWFETALTYAPSRMFLSLASCLFLLLLAFRFSTILFGFLKWIQTIERIIGNAIFFFRKNYRHLQVAERVWELCVIMMRFDKFYYK